MGGVAMPIALKVPIRRMSQLEFGEISFEVMRLRLIAPGVALKITSIDGPLTHFETHARRLLAHLDLRAIAWVNIHLKEVTFTTLEK
jgi:hypothetical protein